MRCACAVFICILCVQSAFAEEFISRQGAFRPNPTPWPTNSCAIATSANALSVTACPAAGTLSNPVTCSADPLTFNCSIAVPDLNPTPNEIELLPNVSATPGAFACRADGHVRMRDTHEGAGDPNSVYAVCLPDGAEVRFDRLLLEDRHPDFSGVAPDPNACGTSPAVEADSTDAAGTVTVGSGTITACEILFASAWTDTPHCVANCAAVGGCYVSARSTTAITITAPSDVAGTDLSWLCIGSKP
jgi:hypothetical protein